MTSDISVIIPTYQHAASLDACLRSVFAQTCLPREVIVVDDGSTDDTFRVLETWRGRGVTVIVQNNGGAPRARNQGFAASTGMYVIFVDADMILAPTMLFAMRHALSANPSVSIAYSSFRFGWKHFRGIPWHEDRLRRMNYIHTSSLIRRSDFPGFDETLRRFQDWDLWLTMLAQGKRGVLVPGVLFTCRVVGASRIGSAWLPSFMYRLPWRRLPWMPAKIARYEAAKDIIRKKHRLPYDT